MIGPNEKLPPVRPTAAGDQEDDGDDSSDEESGEADKDPKDQLPDASRASRRPPDIHPHAYSTARISVPAHTGMVATSGNRVVMATGHHVKIYDLSRSDLPLFDIDFKDALEWKNKDTKISSIAFRWSSSDRIGCFLWLGLSGGHMAEIDVRIGQVTGMKAAAHSSTVTHLFRYGKSMVSMDDNGKVLIWNPSPEEFGEDLIMAFTQPRVFRIAEKQDWAMIIDGRLWTSARADSAGHYAQAHNAAAGSRGPNIRVYDIFTPGSTGKTVLPIEHVGAVTSGTMLPCTPGRAYLGHEGGCISVWELQTEDGYPRCEEVVKVSVSDVLSLEGVNERLWMGGRKGMITAYEVGPRPWLVKNCWRAHEDLPVLRIETDPWALEALGRLAVVSVGRDEQVRYWDGLLGNDWIETELLKRESQFSVFRPLKVLVVTWNIDAAKPDMLTGNEGNVTFIERVLTSVDRPDIMVFGFQELIDLESRRMAAKTVLYTGTGKKKTNDGGLSDKVTKAYRRWHDWLVMKVKLHMPVEEGYTVVGSESMVGLFSCVFVRSKEQIDLKDVAIDKMKRGMGGYYGNKGGIVTRFVIEDSSVCFVNCHLAAGQHHVRQRNQDVAHLFDDKELLPMSRSTDEPIAYVNGGDGTMVLDHEIVFLNGDMNYRIDQRREIVVNAIKSGDFEWLGVHDQLLKEMKHNRAFRLRHFSEGPLKFAPTYKYDRGSDTYDSSEKKRCPAWCDRVLWRSREPSRVRQLHYQRYEPNVSDHRPVSAAFEMTVKKVDREARAQIKTEVQALWQHEEHRLLAVARNFYIDQRLL
ncbi:DNase I-like protein [Punctularia strigosozonata HHB-11173 SS5]|uniref:DNase I-like protein n=1 Tax=Punctularia strigosozonata (strain HHB-11173) TaxID=741275 RepID=R7S3A9_PUNST|nr:DNase I-like protein [Punctularia strigosozonata HHB-11173 SS5]EIN04344.1 DNase I-like protein [Punctularia strigosozonata HHB-11173 SS5]